MNILCPSMRTVDARAIKVYVEDSDIPGSMEFTVDIDTGIVRDWPVGRTVNLYLKVVDTGCYYLLGVDGGIIAELEQQYVPDCLPGKYGDYLSIEIDGHGKWHGFKPDADKISTSFFGES